MTRWVGFSCHTQLARLFSIVSFRLGEGAAAAVRFGSVLFLHPPNPPAEN